MRACFRMFCLACLLVLGPVPASHAISVTLTPSSQTVEADGITVAALTAAVSDIGYGEAYTSWYTTFGDTEYSDAVVSATQTTSEYGVSARYGGTATVTVGVHNPNTSEYATASATIEFKGGSNVETVTVETDSQVYQIPMLGTVTGTVSWTYNSTVSNTTGREIRTKWGKHLRRYSPSASDFTKPESWNSIGTPLPVSGTRGPKDFELGGSHDRATYRIVARLFYWDAAESKFQPDGKASPQWIIDLF